MVYAAITGVSFIVLLGVIFLTTARFMRHQIDDSVANEINEILTDAKQPRIGAIQNVVESLSRHPAGFHYLLQDAHGAVVAGNLPAAVPVEGVREWDGGERAASIAPFASLRGRGVRLSDGYLFVGWSTHQLREMEHRVVSSFAWGLTASLLFAIAGGFVMSGRLMHRIETISNTSRNIIGEDLRQRLPLTPAGDELDHLADSINAMLDRIHLLMEDLRQVTTDIAHDLRTPLTRLRQRLEISLRPDAEAHTMRAALHNAVEEIDSILAIFGALLHIARLEGAPRSAAFNEIDLSGLLATIAELYRPMAEEKEQLLVEDITADLTVSGERELLLQMFANLVENACRHSPPHARVIIEARRAGGRVEVDIVDNGPGIPAHLREKVLQRFFRLEASRTTIGSGLGLSLVNAIVEVHAANLGFIDAAPGLRARVSMSAS